MFNEHNWWLFIDQCVIYQTLWTDMLYSDFWGISEDLMLVNVVVMERVWSKWAVYKCKYQATKYDIGVPDCLQTEVLSGSLYSKKLRL